MSTHEFPGLEAKKPVLGINGLGRIGKLTLWHHIAEKNFSEIVVNIGRKAGSRLQDIALYIEKDSTYGSLHRYLHGFRAKRVIEKVDETSGSFEIDGIPVRILREARNPREILWADHGVKLVVDATGKYTDPAAPPDAGGGSARGHLEAGVEKVVVSAPFKIKDKSRPLPDDSRTIVMGINDDTFDPAVHRIVSAASCTTTCLCYMVKPLLDYFGPDKILSLSMSTIHASTGSQEVLDRLPKAGAGDLRKNRSILNNIILTTTGAARTLAQVIPEMANIGFIAESVRVPLSTGSLIILVIALADEVDSPKINRSLINSVYKNAAERNSRGYISYTEEQNVSSDIIGFYGPAAIIEASETHTRTAMVNLDIAQFCKRAKEAGDLPKVTIPITQAVVYGWYDNELGSYTHMLGDLTVKIASAVYA